MARRSVFALLIALAALSCGELGPTTAFLQARARWEQRGPANYSYQFQRGCFCGGGSTEAVRITVADGIVTSVVRESDGQAVPPDQITLFFRITIDSLFDIVGDALEDASTVSAAYHPFWGYPTQVAIDYILNAADDEVNYFAELTVPTP